ncbi:hypothetical protein AAFG07_30740 [Bradyrhizobium sp. B097]|uniref:hypothetical protein n=1 Tax=Bradyrhizobium sp. B097 TaxID=3140244 RepID=UPI003182EF21
MFDVYVNGKNDLLVVPQGARVPTQLSGNWKKKKRAVRLVSEKIRQDIIKRGYHSRNLVGAKRPTTHHACRES